ncbi:C4-dicarboxylate ABC transporter permease [Zhengella mangrovi]|uniref:TRAP transporter small permease protein n=1 Tax=Zhengella mangrovi TaxID=1982044 RepID=A0A2G1QK83_9HYPH|nr:TRAP transporter small permease subunit [Zhengella mangrovi]PHP65902.1 C4-dicarboxylate ABC transporter permease [Zhengella mangrovi]
MDRLRSLGQLIARYGEHVTAFLLGSMFVVFILQIVFRYFLDLPVGWTVEWVTIAWLWGILFSFAFVIRTGDMIRLDIVYSAVPRGVRRAFDVFTGLTCAAIFAITLPKAWEYVDFMKIERTAYMRWPFNWVFAIYIPFHVAVIVRMLLVAWGGITGGRLPSEVVTTPETHDYD